MKPTLEILENIQNNSKSRPDEVFTRLYRYLLRKDIYFTAYKNLYANSGASTRGVDEDTADGFSEQKIEQIIKSLRDGSYQPKPVRRTYIQKKNGKTRPLGIPTFTDKLVQEVLRMILEAVYEPIFLKTSHGFRPNRSCHTALGHLKYQFHGARWFVEGDIKGCFDNIDHAVLIGFVNDKIKDAKIIQLLHKILKAGYMENWRYSKTYSGTPQGGIVSPMLANIYLHELDKFVDRLKSEFDKPPVTPYTPEYKRATLNVHNIRQRLNRCTDKVQKQAMLEELKQEKAKMLTLPAKSRTDKSIYYVRYADDFLIGVNGNRENCVEIKRRLSDFVANTLKMELSDEKTLVTHSSQPARFLGYDVSVRRDNSIRLRSDGHTQRLMNSTVELKIPVVDKLNAFLFSNGIIMQTQDGKIKPKKRERVLHLTDFEIVSTYNAELRGIANYYGIASNFRDLHYFAYLMEYSCLKTLANKHKCQTTKIRELYKDGLGGWSIPYETKTGKKRLYFADYRKCREVKRVNDMIANAAIMHTHSPTTFENRLKARVCELCGSENSQFYELHHINKVKNLSGKTKWEQIMIAKRRKTMVLCRDCHKKIHH